MLGVWPDMRHGQLFLTQNGHAKTSQPLKSAVEKFGPHVPPKLTIDWNASTELHMSQANQPAQACCVAIFSS